MLFDHWPEMRKRAASQSALLADDPAAVSVVCESVRAATDPVPSAAARTTPPASTTSEDDSTSNDRSMRSSEAFAAHRPRTEMLVIVPKSAGVSVNSTTTDPAVVTVVST
jgi:hypothetical protein